MAEIELTAEDRERITQMRQEHLGYVLYDDVELIQLIRAEEERKKQPLVVVDSRPRKAGADIVRTYWTEERVDGRRVFHRATEEKGILVGSLTENEMHAPVFDLDFEVLQDGSRITFKRDVKASEWQELLKELTFAGLTNVAGFKHAIHPIYTAPAHCEPLRFSEPYLGFSVPFELRKSSTIGHFHLLLQQEIDWPQYLKILMLMTAAGFIEPGYFSLCSEAQMGLLLKPTLKKQEMPRQYTGYGRSSRMSDY